MSSPERDAVLAFLVRLAETPLGAEAVLAEDLDLAVDAEWLAANEPLVRESLSRLGLRHEERTCTFVGGGVSVDLVGYSRRDRAPTAWAADRRSPSWCR